MKKEAEFKVVSSYQPAGDQPKAIEKLANSILAGNQVVFNNLCQHRIIPKIVS